MIKKKRFSLRQMRILNTLMSCINRYKQFRLIGRAMFVISDERVVV